MKGLFPMWHLFIFWATHHHLSIKVQIYSILFCDRSRYLLLKLPRITLKRVTVKDLAMDWQLPRKEWLITLLNNTSLSSKMLFVSFRGMSQGNYPENLLGIYLLRGWSSLFRKNKISETSHSLWYHETSSRCWQWWYQISQHVLLLF